MLTAIKDFVSDSFSAADESDVRTMQVGDYSVIVEQGQVAMVAAIARGNPPVQLREALQETLERIELTYRDDLDRFEGDTTPFVPTRLQLETCTVSEQQPAAKKKHWLAYAVLGTLLAGPLLYWAYDSYRVNKAGAMAVDALRAEPGLVITGIHRDGGAFHVSGLRDPLARNPGYVVAADFGSDLNWRWDFRPFLSLEPEMVLIRAENALRPPPTVKLELEGTRLSLSGEAPLSWAREMRRAAPRIPGITEIRDEGLVVIDEQAPLRESLRVTQRTIADTVLYFEVNAVSLDETQSGRLETLAAAMKRLGSTAEQLDLMPRYLITGYADATGSRRENLRLSHLRALAVIEALVSLGVAEQLFLPPRTGITVLDLATLSAEERARNRRAELEVMLLENRVE
jgi:OOP family OmpA-OmpF porin